MTSRSWQGGSTRAWRKLRAERLRIEPNCRRCGRRGEVVDHVIPLADGGERLDFGNTQALCRRCHKRKTAIESECLDREERWRW